MSQVLRTMVLTLLTSTLLLACTRMDSEFNLKQSIQGNKQKAEKIKQVKVPAGMSSAKIAAFYPIADTAKTASPSSNRGGSLLSPPGFYPERYVKKPKRARLRAEHRLKRHDTFAKRRRQGHQVIERHHRIARKTVKRQHLYAVRRAQQLKKVVQAKPVAASPVKHNKQIVASKRTTTIKKKTLAKRTPTKQQQAVIAAKTRSTRSNQATTSQMTANKDAQLTQTKTPAGVPNLVTITQSYDQAWSHLAAAITQVGYDVLEQEAENGIIYIVNPQAGRGKSVINNPIYELRLTKLGDKSQLTILDANGHAVGTKESTELLTNIQKKLG